MIQFVFRIKTPMSKFLFFTVSSLPFWLSPVYADVPECGSDTCIENAKTFQEQIPKQLLNSTETFFTVTEENDLFGGGTDKHYTNGIRFTYYDMGFRPSDMIKLVNDYMPYVDMNETTRVYYSMGQNLYTPEVITAPHPDTTDRPYAGFLYGSVGTFTFSGDYLDEFELSLGIVGPAALGESIQKKVHEIVNAPEPQGWDSQLSNEPAVIIAAQRTIPEFRADYIGSVFYRVAPHVGLTVGNVYTHINTGVTLQLTSNRWQAMPLRVRPAMPGIGYFSTARGKLDWSAFIGVDGRAVARNIFLDGNTFKSSPSVDKEYFVADFNAGFTLSYGLVQTSYTLNWRTDEFEGQGGRTLFGSISVAIRFD
jgi:hypothetical protein